MHTAAQGSADGFRAVVTQQRECCFPALCLGVTMTTKSNTTLLNAKTTPTQLEGFLLQGFDGQKNAQQEAAGTHKIPL